MWQSIFEAYKHPFVLTYLGASLLVIYLPVSYLKDYIYEYYQSTHKPKSRNSSGQGIKLSTLPEPDGVVKSSSLPGSPMRVNGVHNKSSQETDLEKMILLKEINSQSSDPEVAHPFLHKTSSLEDLRDSIVLTTWEIAKIGMIMAPLWLLTEVLHLHSFNHRTMIDSLAYAKHCIDVSMSPEYPFKRFNSSEYPPY